MAWLGLGAGVFLVILGIVIKKSIKAQKPKKSKKERSISSFDYDDSKNKILRRNQSYNKISQENNSFSHEDREVKKYKKNQDDLKKINSELGELISELSAREKTLKNKIRNLNNQVLSGNEISFDQTLKQENRKEDNNLPLKYLDAIEMYDEGFSLNKIAESLEIGIRETELIIKMYGRGKSNNGKG